MSTLLIPARGGSKRIPRKNIKDFFGKPIIAYSIEAAIQSKCFEKIIVSTDDEEIAEVARKFGAEVPYMRPKKLANDHATTMDVILHAINKLKPNPSDILFCLYATAPFVQASNLQKAHALLDSEPLDYIFSATAYNFPIQRAIRLNEKGFSEMLHPEHLNTRSQDLEPTYHDAGQFYAGRTEAFLKRKNILTGAKSKPFILQDYLVQDIDTLNDWKKAEIMFQSLNLDLQQ